MEKRFSLNFDGYWRESNISGIPSDPGVYCVYSCKYNTNENTVSIKKLIYIGEATDVKSRISNHERKTDWERYLNQGEQLCFNFANILLDDRQRVEAALIFKHKPPANVEYVDTFPFDTTTISTNGSNELLSTYFTVYQTSKAAKYY